MVRLSQIKFSPFKLRPEIKQSKYELPRASFFSLFLSISNNIFFFPLYHSVLQARRLCVHQDSEAADRFRESGLADVVMETTTAAAITSGSSSSSSPPPFRVELVHEDDNYGSDYGGDYGGAYEGDGGQKILM